MDVSKYACQFITQKKIPTKLHGRDLSLHLLLIKELLALE